MRTYRTDHSGPDSHVRCDRCGNITPCAVISEQDSVSRRSATYACATCLRIFLAMLESGMLRHTINVNPSK